MRRVFADTAFYIALLNSRDNLHDVALKLSRTHRVLLAGFNILMHP